jgi:drug/metabolite transporter (DMT)-like permease
MKHPIRWLGASVALLLLTPFAVFPEIMGDIGPQHVALWRNILGMGLIGVAAVGIAVSLIVIMKRRTAAKRMKPTGSQNIQFQ